MKKQARYFHYILAAFFAVLFALCVLDLLFRIKPVKEALSAQTKLLRNEEFDPSLLYITSVNALDRHTDSLLAETDPVQIADAGAYPKMLGEVVRKRFYHGLYTYTFGNNFLAYLITKVSGRSVNEVWDSDEILKSEYAFCGQQSLVMMSLLINKGYKVRSVKMFAPEFKTGHFALEVYYNNSWHFFDPNLEPDQKGLNELNRPSFAALQGNNPLLLSLYHNTNPKLITALFSNYKMGNVNELMPAYIYRFQSLTKALSSICWIICLLFYFLVLRNYNFTLPAFSPRWTNGRVMQHMEV
jgi:hypothetical protein